MNITISCCNRFIAVITKTHIFILENKNNHIVLQSFNLIDDFDITVQQQYNTNIYMDFANDPEFMFIIIDNNILLLNWRNGKHFKHCDKNIVAAYFTNEIPAFLRK